MTRSRISFLEGRCARGCTRSPKATFSKHAHVAEQRVVLEDKADAPLTGALRGGVFLIQQNASAIRKFQAGDNPEQGGLAATRWSQQSHQFSSADAERNIF